MTDKKLILLYCVTVFFLIPIIMYPFAFPATNSGLWMLLLSGPVLSLSGGLVIIVARNRNPHRKFGLLILFAGIAWMILLLYEFIAHGI